MTLRLAFAAALIAVSAGAAAQAPEYSWSMPWPLSPADSVAVNDSAHVSWSPPAAAHHSYAMHDRLLLRFDPRRAAAIQPMDLIATVAVHAKMNKTPGSYSSANDHDSLFIAQLRIGIRGAELFPSGLDSSLAGLDAAALHFEDAHRFQVKLLSLAANTGNGSAALNRLPEGVYFELNIDWQAVYALPVSAYQPQNLRLQLSDCSDNQSPSTNAELILRWTNVAGAIAYDVEWTWVDDFSAPIGTQYPNLPAATIQYSLDRDASRATTTINRYTVPLLYDRGYLLWRVRAAFAVPGHPDITVHSAWSGASANGTVAQAQASCSNMDAGYANACVHQIQHGHQPRKNWQVTTSFAEEGKRKEVMTYADGTHRARQVQTRNNSLNVPIVGETIYDAIGRPALEVIPVPVVVDQCPNLPGQWAPINYIPDFNLEDSLGNVVTYDRWDLGSQQEGCGQAAEPMHHANGAERYYSNAFANDPQSLIAAPKYLPRAEGYPLAHTDYTRDNTGRVRSKGGVGQTFQLSGKPTTTYYGTPFQTQLDRLFGSEAGYAHQYQRVVTVDPNGQASVAYIDMFGRTVATALECSPSAALEAVGSGGQQCTTDLFNGLPSTSPALAQRIGDELRFTTQFTVSCNGSYSFDYNVDVLRLADACPPLGEICPRCAYELEIIVTDACGAEVYRFPGAGAQPGAGIVGTIANTPNGVMFNCQEDLWSLPEQHLPPQPPPPPPSVPLEAGEYTLTKVLRLHQPTMEWYANELFNAQSQCVLPYSAFVEEADPGDCEVDCADCYAELGSLADFLASGRGSQEDYQALREQCDDLCRYDSWCDVLYENMLRDMDRNGQYGKYETDDANNAVLVSDRASVFFMPTQVGNAWEYPVLGRRFLWAGNAPWQAGVNPNAPLWRQPWFEADGVGCREYRDSDGARTKIYLAPEGANFIPAVVSTATNWVLEDDMGVYTYPENLAELRDFFEAWQPGWERSLIRFHPEYCYYLSCRDYDQPRDTESGETVSLPTTAANAATSDAFDGLLARTDGYDDAVSAELIAGGAEPDLAGLDPFVNAPAYAPFGQQLQNKAAAHTTLAGITYSMVQVATVTSRLAGAFPDDINQIPAFGSDPARKNDEWAALKGLYLSAKYVIQKRRADQLASTCGCAGYNFCIGQESTSTWWNRMVLPPDPNAPAWYSNWFAQPINQPCQPCNHYTYWHYRNKTPRVNDPALIPGMASAAQNSAYALFQMTGQCPTAVALQGFIAGLATEGLLGANGIHDITNMPGWGAIHLALNEMQLGTPAPAEQLIMSVNANGDVALELDALDCPITLAFPTAAADFAWDRIVHIAQLLQTQGGFTAAAYYLKTDGSQAMATLTGTVCDQLPLAPCNFQRVCQPNQLARDLQALWNMVNAGQQTMASNLALNTYFPPPGSSDPNAATCQSLLGSSIKGPFNQANLQLRWSYALGSTGPRILLWNASQGTARRYRFNILSADPASFTLNQAGWNAIAYFDGINADYENFFTIDGYNAQGQHVATLRGQAWMEHNGQDFPVQLGWCGLPESALCDQQPENLGPGIARVIEDLVYRMPIPPAPGSSPFVSPSLTDALAAAICPNPASLVVSSSAITASQLSFTLACGMGQPACLTVQVPLNNGAPTGSGFNLARIQYQNPADPGFHNALIPLVGAAQQAIARLECGAFAPCDDCIPEQVSALTLLGKTEEQLIAERKVQPDSTYQAYAAYLAAVDSFNTRWGAVPGDSLHVPLLAYADFRMMGFMNSLPAYRDFLRGFKPSIDRPELATDLARFVIHLSNSRNVKKEYARYLAAVAHYNNRAAAAGVPTLQAAGDSLFRALLLADRVRGYVDMLFAHTPAANPPATLESWAQFDPNDPCVQLYREHYLPAYAALEVATTDSTGRCPGFQRFAPLVSYKEFLGANLCCSDSGLVLLQGYLELFLSESAKCPGELPRLAECATAESTSLAQLIDPTRECQRLYQLWIDAIGAFMAPSPYQAATGAHLEPEYRQFERFQSQGLCKCARNYIDYLTEYLNWVQGMPLPPHPLTITEFCRGGTNPCSQLYTTYRALISAYNTSVFASQHGHALVGRSYEEITSFKLCPCLQAYNSYLAAYVTWTPATPGDWPLPIDLKEFCQMQQDLDCDGLYQQYLLAITTWQPTLAAINQASGNNFTFQIVDHQTFTAAQLCPCVRPYLARLEAMLAPGPAGVNITALENDPYLWNLIHGCRLPVPCPPPPPQPPINDLPFEEGCPCCDDLEAIAAMNAQQAYQQYLLQLANGFRERYRNTCLSAPERLRLSYTDQEFHHTLYYYDQAGSLIRTVPPEGVELLGITHPDDSVAARISQDRLTGQQSFFTSHRLASDHVFNSLGQPIRSAMPDQDPRTEWTTAQPMGLPPEFIPNGMAFSGAKGFAAGQLAGSNRGLAFSSTDGGHTWQPVRGLLGAHLFSGHFPTSATGFAVGDHGTAIRTTDGGASWDLLPAGELLSERPSLRAACFADAATGIVAGYTIAPPNIEVAFAAFTTNAGGAFTPIALTGTTRILGAGRSASGYVLGGIAAGGENGILHAHSGANLASGWQSVPFARTTAHLLCAQQADATTTFAAGQLGVLLSSTDAGATWATRPTGLTWDIVDMAWHDASNGIAIFDSTGATPGQSRGVLRRTADGGRSWLPIDGVPAQADLNDLHIFEQTGTATSVLAAGANGLVLRIYLGNGAAGLATQPQGPGGYAAQSTWAAKVAGKVLVLLANGTTSLRFNPDLANPSSPWSTLAAPAAAQQIAAVSTPAGLRLIARLGTGLAAHYAYATLNLGNNSLGTWQTGPNGLLALALRPDGQAIAVHASAPSAVRIDLTAAPSVTTQNLTATGPAPTTASALTALSAQRLVCLGPNGALRTLAVTDANGTAAWADASDKIAPLPIRAVHRNGDLAACDQGTILRGTGTSWTAQPTTAAARLLAVEWLSATQAVAVGEAGTALRIDVGTGQATPLAVPPSGHLRAAALVANQLYIGADQGRILHCSAPLAPAPAFTPMNWNAGAVHALAPDGAGRAFAFGHSSLLHGLAGTNRAAIHSVYLPPLSAAWARDANQAYLVGAHSTARYTSDGGLTWTTVPLKGTVADLNAVHGNSSIAFACGNGNRIALLNAAGYEDLPTTNSNAHFNSIAVSPSGAVIAVGAAGSQGVAFTRTPATGASWQAIANTPQPLRATWAFPRVLVDNPNLGDERSYEDLLYGGDGGYVGIARYVPASGAFAQSGSDNPPLPFAAGQIAGLPSIRAFHFHDHTRGYALAADLSTPRIRRLTGPLDHGSPFADVGNALSLLGHTAFPETAPSPRCVASPGRSALLVGGLNTANTLGFATRIADEDGLYSQRFWYDALGRLVLSQNSKQAAMQPQRFSYSLYDDLGRVYEAGELEDDPAGPRFADLPPANVGGAQLPQVIDPDALRAWALQRQRYQVTRTFYDQPFPNFGLPGFAQTHLRLRVAATAYYEEFANVQAPDHATHYSYDIHGNVRALVQQHRQLGQDGGSCPGCMNHAFKRIDYRYDLISGNVKQVSYQPGQPDQLHHRYAYDADNRITEVKTSADGQDWHTDARYFYYPHGPLARVELGQHLVQGTDHAYTLQGWLKGINSTRLDPAADMGRDGLPDPGNPNANAARDAFALTLGYFGDDDYKAIHPAWNNDLAPSIAQRPFAPMGTSGSLADDHAPLYNGNIAHSTTALPPQGGWPAPAGNLQPPVLAMAYRYDQLNRLRQARGITGIGAGNTWHEVNDPVANRNRSTYAYDANGNILTAERHDDGGQPYDQLHYSYQHQPNAPDKLLRNRLYQLEDLADQPNALVNEPGGAKDIAYTGPLPFINEAATVNTDNNYAYDALGNLVRDTREGIAAIDWTAAGKVRRVVRTDGMVLNFAYGAGGQRIMKEVIPAQGDAYREHYVRDAQGNIMAIYRATPGSLALTERPLYGSARLGALHKSEELYAATSSSGPDPVQQVELRYELTDHLGNVSAVLTGRLLPGNGMGSAWQPEVVAAQGYEPFGSLLPGRNYSSDAYRFGFNGAEKDDEVHGSTGTSYDFGARMLDPRVGRWLSLDPLGAKYPAITPYAFALNSPLLFMDPNGKEGVVTIQRDPQGGGTITISTIVYITGAGATQGKADEFNAGYSRFAPSSTYTDASGQKFDVNINITFQYAPDRSAIELQRGENILELTDENLRSHATGVGGTVRTLDPKTGEWTESFSAELGQLARLGKNDHNAQTETHEVLHLLGLSDRYKDIPLFGRNDQNERVQTGEVSVGNPGFQDDIMGTGIEFSPVHTENYGNYILGQESSKGNQFILDRFVDLDASGNLIGGEQPKKP